MIENLQGYKGPHYRVAYGMIIFFLFMGLSPLSGCREEGSLKDPEGTVKKMADSYWTQRLLKKNFEATYDMELEKDSLSFLEYQKRVSSAGGIIFESIRADEVDINGDQARVKIIVTYKLRSVPEASFKGSIQDKWVIKGNQVKHVLGEANPSPIPGGAPQPKQ